MKTNWVALIMASGALAFTSGAALAGDAAALADPFTGEGLGQAIRSGQLAAEVALDAAARRDVSAASLAAYDRLCYEAFDRDLRTAVRLARAMTRWPSPTLHGVTSGADVLQRFLRIPIGEGTYRAFLRWFLPRALWRWARPTPAGCWPCWASRRIMTSCT